ncbi:YIP1 family protein [Pseudooceanicola sp. CBS1P-1]|uniref:Yip1 domain-containing protein n=1 Tax=Pseudooceanicola albus TaxID=2692189 RepID=A0A6L7FXF2_9RHOB|nr:MULTISPECIES: Yip1 family protein [Pseudooceanicola]MBT9383298.1 YIP1 family protein [Pseudooceanicola endophyticus]MXN16379.1 hypothetical protein [Pseudooceanicola albus]
MQYWIELARQSILNPRAAAPIVAGLILPPGTLALLVALVSVLNGIFYGLFLPAGLLPGLFGQPIPMAVLFGAIFVAGAAALTGVGRLFGGTGEIRDILRVTIFLQIIRLAVQVVLIVIALLVPVLATFLGTAAGVWGLYMMICFIAAAHRMDSRVKSFGVIGVTFFAAIIALSVLLSAMGLAPMEV